MSPLRTALPILLEMIERVPMALAWVLIVLLATLVPAPRQANAQSLEPLESATIYRPEIGQPHPDFVLPGIDDGQPVRLSDYRGKKVLLVHFASW